MRARNILTNLSPSLARTRPEILPDLTYNFDSVIKWKTALWATTDTLTITTSTSQLIITSAHYTVIAKELDRENHLITSLLKWPWSLSLCQCALFEKSQLQSFMTSKFARKIVDYCLQVRISKNLMLCAHQRQRV